MTEQELRQKYVNVIIGWLGMSKAKQTHRPIVDLYNTIRPLPRGYKLTYNDAYCAATVSAAAQYLDLTNIIFPACDTGNMINAYKKVGRWVEDDSYVPTTGDIIMYNWNDSGNRDCNYGSSHVGVVVSSDSEMIHIIEGNKGGNGIVGYRDIPVNGRYIRGFCCPDYQSKAEAYVADMHVSERCIEFIKRNEGFIKFPMWDYAQYSVGYGSHCKQNEYPNGITKEQAEALLRKELSEEFEPVVNKISRSRFKPFDQCEFDALCSFSYNVGTAWSKPSNNYTVYKYVIGEYPMDEAKFNSTMEAWSKAGGKTLPGLLRRRQEEARMYLNGNYNDGQPNCRNNEEVIDMTMTKDELVAMIDERIKAALVGEGTNASGWATKELAEAVASGITDGTRPQGYATREEVAAMVYRGTKI